MAVGLPQGWIGLQSGRYVFVRVGGAVGGHNDLGLHGCCCPSAAEGRSNAMVQGEAS